MGVTKVEYIALSEVRKIYVRYSMGYDYTFFKRGLRGGGWSMRKNTCPE